MRNPATIIGEQLRDRRAQLGLVQLQLATLSGVNIRTIQLVEQGKANPSLDTLLKLTDTLGLNIELVIKDMSQNND